MSCHLHYRETNRRRLAILSSFAVITVALLFADLATGSSGLALRDIFEALQMGPNGESPECVILWSLRLPTTLTALLVGAALSLAGLSIQTITGNALASPSTLGITSGACFGAALAIALGLSVGGALWVGTVGAAFVAALLVSALILAFGRVRGMTPSTLILAGILMNFLFMAMEELLIYLAAPEVAQVISGWTFGNLERASWLSTLSAGMALFFGLCILVPQAWRLTILSLGEERAKSLGVPVARLRLTVFLTSALLVAASVSFIGTISFIGLVAPHCARLLLGEDQRHLIAGSVLAGGFLMLLSSLVAKLLSTGSLLPVGIVTAIAGVPFLLFLLLRGGRNM